MKSKNNIINISTEIYNELLNKEYWDVVFDRMTNKKRIPVAEIEVLFHIKESFEYIKISKAISKGTYKWSIPEKLELRKDGGSKKRIVYMYDIKDRYILGVIYKVFNEVFKDYISPNCFSYRSKVNTSDAIKYIKDIKQNKSLYGVKLDISSYFNSVSKEHLVSCLDMITPEGEGVRKTLDKLFLDDKIIYAKKQTTEYKSLIPGCALGSFFANFCLRDIDLYFKENGILYARYSDDIILFAETKEELDKHLDFIKERIFSYGLKINESKYEYFDPNDTVDYLGLALSNGTIDISAHAKMKIKRTIKRWIRKGRLDMDMLDKDFNKVAYNIVNRLNWKLYKCYIQDVRKFGWAYYAFRYITTPESLIEIDFYLRDRLRYLKTGKNNKANVNALNDDDFRDLHVLSLYDMYNLFHEDFDYYCEVAYLI